MTLREEFEKETGIYNDCLTYLNDSKEFVIDERYFDWLELRAQKKTPDHSGDESGSGSEPCADF